VYRRPVGHLRGRTSQRRAGGEGHGPKWSGLRFCSAVPVLAFFEGKPTKHLPGEGIKPEHLNDDKLGRVLEKLHEGGLSSLFVEIASEAMGPLGVDGNQLHLDVTSFHLHGRYPHQREQHAGGAVFGESDPEPIRITRGYSRDHRPDLKQFVVDLMCSGDGGVPLFFRAADGNDSEAASFANLISEFREQVDQQTLLVADAALYSEHNLRSLEGLSWLSWVSQTLTEARAALEETDERAFRPSRMEGYCLH